MAPPIPSQPVDQLPDIGIGAGGIAYDTMNDAITVAPCSAPRGR
jgi:hypothetical protein